MFIYIKRKITEQDHDYITSLHRNYSSKLQGRTDSELRDVDQRTACLTRLCVDISTSLLRSKVESIKLPIKLDHAS
ncbi:hypothetical protein IMY05_012G0031200 [Salix suchowensis]|nr:hypothetical protein IMY05_012G0031200 [Salix suchowensis]